MTIYLWKSMANTIQSWKLLSNKTDSGKPKPCLCQIQSPRTSALPTYQMPLSSIHNLSIYNCLPWSIDNRSKRSRTQQSLQCKLGHAKASSKTGEYAIRLKTLIWSRTLPRLTCLIKKRASQRRNRSQEEISKEYLEARKHQTVSILRFSNLPIKITRQPRSLIFSSKTISQTLQM